MDLPVFPEFAPLNLDHKERVTALLDEYPPEISEHNFTNLFIWRHHYGFELSRYEDGILFLARPEEEEPFFLPPIGLEDPVPAFHDCLNYLEEQGYASAVRRVGSSMVEAHLKKNTAFTCILDRDQFDYVYQSEDLIHLAGRKYHRKKNHLNKFKKNYTFEYKPLSDDMLEDCFNIVEQWCILKNCEESPSLMGEERAIREALMHIDKLSFRAGALMVEGKLEAFAFGESLNKDTAVIHIEKANGDIQGIYAAINQQFCEREWSGFRFINREQDLGVEGLRKAKESYVPHHFVEKYMVTLRKT